MATSQVASPVNRSSGVGRPTCCHQKETPPLCTRSLSLGVCPPTGGGGSVWQMGLSAAGAAMTALLHPAGLLAASPGGADEHAGPRYDMVSVNDEGRAADDNASGVSVSRDGRWVAYSSRAQNLDRRTRPGYPQVFLRDNRTRRVRAVGADRRGR